VTVRTLGPSDEPAYNHFLGASPHASLYSSLEYRSFLQAVVPGAPEYLIAVARDRIVGALPLFVHRAPGAGVVMNSLPWYGSHGGCVLMSANDDFVRRALLAEYCRRVVEADALSSTLILLPGEQFSLDTYRAVIRPAAEDSRIGQITDLPAAGEGLENRLLSCFSRKTRNLVRKALRQSFDCVIRDDEEAWRVLHRLHTENLQAIGGKAKPWSHFAALRERLPGGWRRLYVAADAGRPVAALLLARYRDTVEYVTPVVDAEYRSRQALSFVIYRAMLDAAHDGLRYWNWGGTWPSQQTLFHFKQGWGARESAYTYIVTSHDGGLRLSALKPRLGELFPYYYVYPYDRF
jgi:hypothetical protein